MSAHATKLAATTREGLFLIVQPGDDEIDHYSIVLSVPPIREAAFLKAVGKKQFHARDFGEVIYYGAGELSLEEALEKAQSPN